jgi:hypothetical protein
MQSEKPLKRKCAKCKMYMHPACFNEWIKHGCSIRCPQCRASLHLGPHITRNKLKTLSDKQYVDELQRLYESKQKSQEDIMGIVLSRNPIYLSYDSKLEFYSFLLKHYELYRFLKDHVGHVLDWIIL